MDLITFSQASGLTIKKLHEPEPMIILLTINFRSLSQTCDTCPSRVDTCFFISVQFVNKKLTFDIFEIQTSVLHVIKSEFHQEFNGDGSRHVTRVRHVSRYGGNLAWYGL